MTVFYDNMYGTLVFSFLTLRSSFVSVGLCIKRILCLLSLCCVPIIVFIFFRLDESFHSNINSAFDAIVCSFCRKDGEFTKFANKIRLFNVELFEWIYIYLNRRKYKQKTNKKQTKNTKNMLTISGQIIFQILKNIFLLFQCEIITNCLLFTLKQIVYLFIFEFFFNYR